MKIYRQNNPKRTGKKLKLFTGDNNNMWKFTDKTIKDSLDLSLGNNNFNPGIFEYRMHLQEILNLYVKEYPEVERLDKFNVEDVNLQWYPGKGGFKTWHYERGTKGYMNRVLVFMTYLNDVENGGTHFKYQDITTPAIKGLTVIWPPDWTHTHKGQISDDKKIIATGWFTLIWVLRKTNTQLFAMQ